MTPARIGALRHGKKRRQLAKELEALRARIKWRKSCFEAEAALGVPGLAADMMRATGMGLVYPARFESPMSWMPPECKDGLIATPQAPEVIRQGSFFRKILDALRT